MRLTQSDTATVGRATLGLAGVLLLGVAASFSSREIESALTAQPGSLAWGPALFRGLLVFHGLLLLPVAVRWQFQRTVSRPSQTAPAVWWALGGMSLAALALRCFRLDTGLWLDEISAVTEYIRLPLAQTITSFASQNQHMLYSVLAHFSISVFGEHAWSLRLPAVLFGVADIWGLFLLGQRFVGDREALVACGLLTVSYHHVWFSQNARGYTGLLFFTLLATWLWLEAGQRNRLSWWFSYSVVAALGLLAHLTMSFVLLTHLVVWLKRPRWQALAAMVLAGTLALQVYSLSLPEFIRSAAGEISLPSEWTSPIWLLQESLRSLRIGFASLLVLVVGALTAAVGWIDLLRREATAAVILVLPAILSGATMAALGHNLWPRFFFFSMGFALLVAIHGAFRLPHLVGIGQIWSRRLGLVAGGLLIAASAATLPLCYAWPKQDFIGAREYVERNRQPGERVAGVGLAAAAYDYYAPDWQRPKTEAEFLALRRDGPLEWVVYTLPVHLRAWQPEVWRAIQTDYNCQMTFPGTLGDGEVNVCRELKR